MPEAYTVISYLAAVTESLRLGVLVSGITHRHPAVLGRMVATLDVLSGGRANLGLGVAWDRKEHEGYGIPFPSTSERYALLEDTLEMLPLLWGKGAPSFQGKVVSAAALSCYPRPIQDPIPILIGGSGEEKTLRLVARHAQACNLFGRPDVVARKVEVLHRHCAEIGRDPTEVEVTHLVNALTAPDRQALRERVELLRGRNSTAEEYAARYRAGTPEDQFAHFTAYASAGAGHSIVVLPDVHLEGSIEAFANVIELFRHSN
jgi:alkanesulfonate monooxygenase SsuD/methylene tetrahydromethanopterin reductase-like flavin-dependent oxidoreductase (luciferase family)